MCLDSITVPAAPLLGEHYEYLSLGCTSNDFFGTFHGRLKVDFIAVANLKRGSSEAVCNVDSRFEAQVANFDAHYPSSQVPEVLTAHMFRPTPSWIADIIFLCFLQLRHQCLPKDSTTENYLKCITYNLAASQSPHASSAMTNAPSAVSLVLGNVRKKGSPRTALRSETPIYLLDVQRQPALVNWSSPGWLFNAWAACHWV